MAFADIERVVGFPLPRSARSYAAWWANDPNPNRHSNAWLSIGWETEEVDLAAEAVTFRRGTNVGRKTLKTGAAKRGTARTISIDDIDKLPQAPEGSIRVAIRMHWKQLGSIRVDPSGKLAFPLAPELPAIYRLRLLSKHGLRHYIGEAVNLKRRFGNYRNPGPTQATSLRINEALRNHLAAGDEVEVDLIASKIALEIGGQELTFDLADKATRRLLEQAAVVANAAIEIESLNR